MGSWHDRRCHARTELLVSPVAVRRNPCPRWSMRLRSIIVGLTVALTLACDPGALLGPDAPQGIDGVALRGPVCPVVTQDEACEDQPHQAWIQILDGDGRRVARIRTDQEGRFRVGLVPGSYTLVPESGDPFPVASPQDVVVTAGVFTDVVVHFDTGIR